MTVTLWMQGHVVDQAADQFAGLGGIFLAQGVDEIGHLVPVNLRQIGMQSWRGRGCRLGLCLQRQTALFQGLEAIARGTWYHTRRRGLAAGIMAPIGNHSFRATGITAYLVFRYDAGWRKGLRDKLEFRILRHQLLAECLG